MDRKWLWLGIIALCISLLGSPSQAEPLMQISNGVAFAITHAGRSEQTLQIRILQQPLEDGISLIDNQTEYPSDDLTEFAHRRDAAQYGEKLMGTLCDILEIIDPSGQPCPLAYTVTITRDGSALVSDFVIEVPPTVHPAGMQITFWVGANESLNARFPDAKPLLLTIP